MKCDAHRGSTQEKALTGCQPGELIPTVLLDKVKAHLRNILFICIRLTVRGFKAAHMASKSLGATRVGGWRITDLSIGCCRDAPSHIHISCNIIESH